tara:strand:+ start:3103 stop:5004 length:1902 start_codon:yes stop_codon:yes gene_type:complete
MALAGFISKIVQSITRTTFQFNKTLDVLISRFKNSCPSTQELKNLIQQKNEINGALVQIEQKISTLNKVASTSEAVVTGIKAAVTIIKQLPIPTSVPPGVGIPVNIINNFSDALDNLGTIIDKEEGSLDSIPEALDLISKDVSSVITKLNDLDVALNDCLEKDENITQEDLDTIVATTGNFVDVLTNAELEAILNSPPGLLYGDYYLRLNYIDTDFSFDKKQIMAQNKESVLPPGEFYNENTPIEKLFGDKSFSSSNIVLVDEMKWTIDTKDLIFPPPPPAEDPLKAIYKQGQITLLIAIYGATQEEAEELYDLAWELSQGKGPHASYYDTLVKEAFDNSRTILEQAVANEGYEWKDGDRILDSTIKKLFLSGVPDNKISSYISQIRNRGEKLLRSANNLGGNYDSSTKSWNNDGDFSTIAKLEAYAGRLYRTAEQLFNDNNIGNQFLDLRPEMKRRKRLMQAIFEEAKYLSLQNPDISFTDPLSDYFNSKGVGYNTPIINGQPIIGNPPSSLITVDELDTLYELQKDIDAEWWIYNVNHQANPPITSNGVTDENRNAYSKTQLLLKLRTALGNEWYNSKALEASELSFWYLNTGVNPNSALAFANDPNRLLDPSDKWYFEFGKNGLPVPTGS